MTRPPRARLAGLLALTALLLAGCEDPSGVGLTVLDPGDTDPRARVFPADAAFTPLDDFTGALATRVLAGRAEDPLFGTVEATGYIDYGQPTTLPSNFFTTAVERVVLRLQPDYRFGEEQGSATYDLYEIAEGWNANVLPSDSSLAVLDRLLTTFRVAPGDTLLHVELPADWVAERDSLFRSTGFNQQFHGFQLRPRAESRAALGFDGAASSLLVIADRGEQPDSVFFGGTQVFSNVRRDLAGTSAPPQLLPLQDGTGQALGLTFNLDALAAPLAVTAAFIRLDADTTLLAAGPPGFVRPLARTIALYGIQEGLPPEPLSLATLDRRTQSYVFSTPAQGRQPLGAIIQRELLGQRRYTGFAVGFPLTPNSLDVAPIVTSEGARPRLVLLVVPSE